jgi:uridine kinase
MIIVFPFFIVSLFFPGVQTIAYAFPKVKIVTTAVDDKVNDQFYVVPGIGNFGDRYYGTEAGLSSED